MKVCFFGGKDDTEKLVEEFANAVAKGDPVGGVKVGLANANQPQGTASMAAQQCCAKGTVGSKLLRREQHTYDAARVCRDFVEAGDDLPLHDGRGQLVNVVGLHGL